jgi:hypothetical protein
MKVDLQKNIAELFAHTLAIALTECIDKFVGLFEKIFNEGLMSLFGIPWTSTR